jgi:hypothetical protein
VAWVNGFLKNGLTLRLANHVGASPPKVNQSVLTLLAAQRKLLLRLQKKKHQKKLGQRKLNGQQQLVAEKGNRHANEKS